MSGMGRELGIKGLDAYLESKTVTVERDGFDIHTLEGVMHANRGDWIIQGVKGELDPCKPDIFEATYESAE